MKKTIIAAVASFAAGAALVGAINWARPATFEKAAPAEVETPVDNDHVIVDDSAQAQAPVPAPVAATVDASDATPATYTTSFDCGKAKSDSEHLVCENEDLAEKDVQLANLVAKARDSATDQDKFRDGLRQAWNKRQQCHDKECVSSWYDDQIDAFQAGTHPVGDTVADAASERAADNLALTHMKLDNPPTQTMANCRMAPELVALTNVDANNGVALDVELAKYARDPGGLPSDLAALATRWVYEVRKEAKSDYDLSAKLNDQEIMWQCLHSFNPR